MIFYLLLKMTPDHIMQQSYFANEKYRLSKTAIYMLNSIYFYSDDQ